MRQNVESLQTKGKQQAVDGPKIVPSGHSIQQLRFMVKGFHVTVSNNSLPAVENKYCRDVLYVDLVCAEWFDFVHLELLDFVL